MAIHHERFYFEQDPMAIFLVGDRLFKVHRHHLIQESEVFRDMFSVPNQEEEEIEGMRDERPILLPNVSVKEFELLLTQLYPSPRSGSINQASKEPEGGVKTHGQLREENLALLSVAHRFAFEDIFVRVVQRLIPTDIPVIQRISLGDKYGITEWLLSAYVELLDRKGSLTRAELHALGSSRVIQFIRARDFMHRERLHMVKENLGISLTGRIASKNPELTVELAKKYFNL